VNQNHVRFSPKYMLMTYRLDMLWLPVAFWMLFLIIAWFTRNEETGFGVTTAFLGAALPLTGGMLASYAVLEDPALELQFATPRPAWAMLIERVGFIFIVTALCAFIYQAAVALLGYDLSPLGTLLARQMAWLAPTLTAMALGATVAFALRQSIAGAAITGLVWFGQLMAHDWFLSSPWACYTLLMMGSNYSDHPALAGNRVVLTGLAALLMIAAWALLRRQERYI
jgi:hypothetical protein